MTAANPEIRLLLVDDEPEFLQAMEPGLGRRGFDVTLAENGLKALELLARHSFDVIVLDVKMPMLDGVDTFREIKRSAPEIPVILLTGHGNIEQAFETTREGVFEYLTKPCEVERLAEVVWQAAAEGERLRGPESVLPQEIRLLFVDDDPDFIQALTPSLERRGVLLTAVHDGLEAIQAARDMRFEVALVDVVMPGMDGLTLLNRLKEADPLLEVIILTGNPSVADVRRGLQEGAFDYLTKPQRVEKLVATLQKAWERRQERMETGIREEADRIIRKRPDY